MDGRVPKDSKLTFNRKKRGVMSRRNLLIAERAKKVELMAVVVNRDKMEREALRIGGQIEKLQTKLLDLRTQLGYEEEGKAPPSETQMLKDMWQVYRMAGGVARLKQTMKDDREFRAMAKEMLKVEATVAKLKKDDQAPNQMVYIVLKGLEEEKKFEGVKHMDQFVRQLDPAGV